MTQIGIGQISHAKPAAKPASFTAHNHSGTGKAAMKQIKRAAKSAAASDENAKKEGQLAVDILQTDTEMIIICPIAGVSKADIKVAIQDDVLTIRGERKAINGINDNNDAKGKQAIVRELFWGTFSRSIVLPDHIDRKEIAARVHEHMLIISIPKTEDFKTRIIHINE